MATEDTWLVIVHVPVGLVAVIAGVIAMLARKGGRAHGRAGLIYLAALTLTALSGLGLAITRWPRFPHLIALGTIAGLLAGAGYAFRRRPSPLLHLLGMGMSYTVMLTAFYVDNGPKLPVWRLLPPAAFWFLPSLVAAPLLIRAARRHAHRVRQCPKS